MSHLRWVKGGDASFVAVDGERVVLDSSLSSPPGSLAFGALVNGGDAIRIKVRGCKRVGERFRIEGRILDASRDLRTRIAALIQ